MAKTLAAPSSKAATGSPKPNKGSETAPRGTVRVPDSDEDDGGGDEDEYDPGNDNDEDEDFGDDDDFDDDFEDEDEDFDDEDEDDTGDEDEEEDGEELAARGPSPTPEPEPKPEPVKRPRGRPRKDGSPPRSRLGNPPGVGMVASPAERGRTPGGELLPIPKPKGVRNRVRMTGEELVRYWNEIPGDARENRVKAIVYRDWPVIDRARLGKAKYIGEMWEPPESVDGFRERFGTGDYRVWLNDMGMKNENLAIGVVQTARDMREWPPVIELEDLVLDDPQNQSYVQYLETTGRLPRQEDEMREDKAGAEAVGVLGRLAERALSGERKGGEGSITEESFRSSMNMVVDGHRTAMELTKEALLKQADKAASEADGTDRALKLIEIAEKLGGTKGGTDVAGVIAAIVPLIQRDNSGDVLKQVVEAFQASQREMLQALQGVKGQAQNPEASPSLLRQMKDLLELKKLTRELSEDDEGGGGSKEPWWAQYMPAVIGMVGQAVQVGTQFIQGQGMGQGRGVAQPGAVGPAGPLPSQVAAGIAGQGGQRKQEPNPQQGAGQGGGQVDDQTANFLAEIRRPLIRFLMDPDSDGVEFANYFVSAYGDAEYRRVLGAGKMAVEFVLKQDPQIRAALEHDKDMAAQFIQEFFDRDRILAEEEQGTDNGEEGEDDEEIGGEAATVAGAVKANGAAKAEGGQGEEASGAAGGAAGRGPKKVTRHPSGAVDRTG